MRNVHQINTPPIASNNNPACTIRRIGILPVPYTMAFGGVETGSTNARLAAIHAPSTGGTGEKLAVWAMAMSTGTIMLVAAVFDASSVRTRAVRIATPVKPQMDSNAKHSHHTLANRFRQFGFYHQLPKGDASPE